MKDWPGEAWRREGERLLGDSQQWSPEDLVEIEARGVKAETIFDFRMKYREELREYSNNH